MISPLSASARASDALVLPTAVGPVRTMTCCLSTGSVLATAAAVAGTLWVLHALRCCPIDQGLLAASLNTQSRFGRLLDEAHAVLRSPCLTRTPEQQQSLAAASLHIKRWKVDGH